jgi:hypothetical protein
LAQDAAGHYSGDRPDGRPFALADAAARNAADHCAGTRPDPCLTPINRDFPQTLNRRHPHRLFALSLTGAIHAGRALLCGTTGDARDRERDNSCRQQPLAQSFPHCVLPIPAILSFDRGLWRSFMSV